MKVLHPAPNATFSISSTPAWPEIEFRTDGSGQHRWEWTITWRNFTQSGSATTPDHRWNAGPALTNAGGLLRVRVSAERALATATVTVRGTNPSPAEVRAYLVRKTHGTDLEPIIHHESRCRQFTARGEPLRSFDDGYGLCQVTNPAPTIEEVWNWKLGVDLGLRVWAEKRTDSIRHLSKNKRTYTATQLKYETTSRWNGGHYHDWDDQAGAWVRRPNILCDTATGNIGWDMNNPQNAGKTMTELRARDRGGYGAGGKKGGPWYYHGVCYADHVLR